jgi:SAM-dependent methyltransferase
MTPTDPSARDRFLALLRTAVSNGALEKLTLGKHRGTDATLRNLFVRPVALKAGPQLCFVWRHATRDITKNLPPAEALAQLESLLGSTFLDAHLFTSSQIAQLECEPDGSSRLAVKTVAAGPRAVASDGHDRLKSHLIPATSSWLRALGVTNDRGQPRAEMAAKFRQIQKFTELLRDLLDEAKFFATSGSGGRERQPLDGPFRQTQGPEPVEGLGALTRFDFAQGHPEHAERMSLSNGRVDDRPLRIVDMGCGKGYLTFALAALLGAQAEVLGVEVRPELVALCNDLARSQGFAQLHFAAGSIADTPLEGVDVVIALHACDTATDDALARGLAAGASLLVVAPCCQKELRPQLAAPPVLADALRHGIFQERQAEFVTDALRAQLLDWAGYRTKVFEFISTEHTPKNLMLAAIKSGPRGAADDALAGRIRAFARFYGIRTQRLATHLAFPLL